LKNRI